MSLCSLDKVRAVYTPIVLPVAQPDPIFQDSAPTGIDADSGQPHTRRADVVSLQLLFVVFSCFRNVSLVTRFGNCFHKRVRASRS